MKTFLEWLKLMPKPKLTQSSVPSGKIKMFSSFADNSNGTDNYDLSGLWLTKIYHLQNNK